ncbi:MAG: phosphate signaling complex PhoU family protein, partial [Acidimicrobiales bacterium]
MPGELRLQYHQQLEEIESRIIQLFAMVAEGLAAATAAMLEGDSTVVGILVERDSVVDTLYRDVEEVVNTMLVLQAPVARDLRFLLTVLRVVPELERSHDLVEHIARRGAQGLQDDLSPRTR